MHIYCNMHDDVLYTFAKFSRVSIYNIISTDRFITMSLKTGKWFSIDSGFNDSIFIPNTALFIYIIELQSMGIVVTKEMVKQLLEKPT